MKTATAVTIPNLITSMRILLALIAAVLFAAEHWERLAALLCVSAAMLDALDGWCARLFSQCSKLGKLLDPIADKLIITVMYAVISIHINSILIWILFALMLLREIGISLLRDFAFRRRNVLIASSRLGKFKMFVQTLFGSFFLLYGYFAMDDFNFPVGLVAGAMIFIVVVTYASAHQYLVSWRLLIEEPAEQRDSDSDDFCEKDSRMVAGK